MASAPEPPIEVMADVPYRQPYVDDRYSVAAERIQESRHPQFDVLILGGRPIREPVAWLGHSS